MKRKGFLLLWAVSAIAAAGILLSGTALLMHTALDWEGKRETALEETLLAQDMMERAKYFIRFGRGTMPSSGEVMRNGKPYEVEIRRQEEIIQDIHMIRLRCRVKGQGSEGFLLETLVEGRS